MRAKTLFAGSCWAAGKELGAQVMLSISYGDPENNRHHVRLSPMVRKSWPAVSAAAPNALRRFPASGYTQAAVLKRLLDVLEKGHFG